VRISEDRRWKVEERVSDDGDRFGRMVERRKPEDGKEGGKEVKRWK
jgi:hypothetical protein